MEVILCAAGKIISAFHLVRALALGADLCNSARGMMFALGCIQARACNTNKCPVGIATQDPTRNQGIVVEDKARRVARFHGDTIRTSSELIASTGHDSPDRIKPHDILRRISATTIKRFDQIYEYLPEGCLREPDRAPEHWIRQWNRADARRF